MQGDVALAALLGLLIGSFLNVVIHRLPLIMEAQWDAECAEHQAAKAGAEYSATAPALTLCQPRSRCPHCGHAITLVRKHSGAELDWFTRQMPCMQTSASVRATLW